MVCIGVGAPFLKTLAIIFLCLGNLSLVVGSTQAASFGTVDAGSPTTPYYLHSVEVEGAIPTAYYLDTPTPKGTLRTCVTCTFYSRPLLSDHMFEWLQFRTYVLPGAAYRFIWITFGCASANFAKLADRIVRLENVPTGWEFVDFSIGYGPPCIGCPREGMLPITCLANQRIYLELASQGTGDYKVLFVFGDTKHPSYMMTDKLDLEGQAIPEFQVPSLILIASAMLTIFASRRKKSTHDVLNGNHLS